MAASLTTTTELALLPDGSSQPPPWPSGPPTSRPSPLVGFPPASAGAAVLAGLLAWREEGRSVEVTPSDFFPLSFVWTPKGFSLCRKLCRAGPGHWVAGGGGSLQSQPLLSIPSGQSRRMRDLGKTPGFQTQSARTRQSCGFPEPRL